MSDRAGVVSFEGANDFERRGHDVDGTIVTADEKVVGAGTDTCDVILCMVK